MLSVIMGKQKTAPMPSNLLVVGGSFTGRLKIYDRDTLQEVTGVDTSAFTSILGVAGDADNVYVCGQISTGSGVRKISRLDKSVNMIGTSTNPYQLAQNICVDATYLFYTANSTVRDLGRKTLSNGTDTYLYSSSTYSALALCQSTGNVYAGLSGAAQYIKAYTKAGTAINTLAVTTAPQRNGMTADSNFLYFGSTTSGDFHVYDLGLTTEQTGYPTIPGGIYSILNDDTNVYIGSTAGNIYVINKAAKVLATIATGLGANIVSLSQTSDLLYASSASGIVKIGKSNLSTVYSVLSGLSSINTIMVI